MLDALPAWTTLTLFGEADKLKFEGATAFMVSKRVVVLVKLPDVPVMVTVKFPVAAVLLAVNVKMLVVGEPLVGVLPGLNAAVTPAGKPEADKPTLLLNPFCGVTVIVLVPLAP